MDKVEVRAFIKYFCKKNISPKEIHDDMKTVGDESPSFSMMKKWAAEFRSGRRAWRSWCTKEATTDENIEFVNSVILCDKRRSLCDIARQIGICFGSILTDIFGMSKI